MKYFLPCLFFLLAAGPAARAGEASSWEGSVVRIEVSYRNFYYYQPWNEQVSQAQKTGVVLGRREIVTPAQYLSDQTLVRLQKHGSGKWWIGRVVWVDQPANLAMVTVDDDSFWGDLKLARLAAGSPAEGQLRMLRWNDGVLESRNAAFRRFVVDEGMTSEASYLQFEINVESRDGGWGEPLVSGSRVAGLAVSQSDNDCTVIPSSFVESVIEAHRGVYRGLGYFRFYWQPAINPVSLNLLGLQGPPRGVFVTSVPEMADGAESVIKPRDLILQIDGFDVDIQGNYNDPEFGRLPLENLATRRKWAGDEVQMKILRAGREITVSYRLPKYDYADKIVPAFSYDQDPEYDIFGGLVFQPLVCDYLRSWGGDWRKQAPFRLNYFTQDYATPDQSAVVILSVVLPDEYNIGYQDARCLVVETVNGRRVAGLADLAEAFKHPLGGFQVIEFLKGETLHRIVLAAGDAEREATKRVLANYGISKESRFSPRKAEVSAPIVPIASVGK